MTIRTDNFNRSNANTLGGNWGGFSSVFANFGISSNAAGQNGGSSPALSGNRWTADSFGINQFSESVVNNLSDRNMVGVLSSGSALTFYEGGQANDVYADYKARIWKFLNGTLTLLATHGTLTIAQGDKIKLVAEDTNSNGTLITLRLFQNDTEILSTSDSSSPITSGAPSISGYAPGSTGIFEDWQGGDVAGGGTSPTLTSMSPSSAFANPTVPVKLIGVAFVGTNLNGASGGFDAVSGFTFSALNVTSSTTLTVDIQIAAGKTPGAYNFTFTTTAGTSNALSFAVSSTSGGSGAQLYQAGHGVTIS